MERIPLVTPDRAGLGVKLASRFTHRSMRQVTGRETPTTPGRGASRRTHAAWRRARSSVLAILIAAPTSLCASGPTASAAVPSNCAGGETSLATSHTSCLTYMAGPRGATMVGDAYYGFYPSKGFKPANVKQCWLYLRLKSSYHTEQTIRSDCTADAREGGLGYRHTRFWGAGRRSGDTYWQSVWMVIRTGVTDYSSGPEAATVRLVKP